MRTLEQVPIVHLHGWARQPEKGYVFARSEYARVMAEANAWMTVLADIMPVEPFIIAGTTLDEIDLEFYLARRSAISSRKDRGPSFFVEPFPDRQTEAECIRYGLNLYRGTVEQFFAEIDAIAPGRTGPYGLVASETQGLFPTRAPRSVVLSFSNDFDRVPSNPTPGANPAKFCYGNPPEWSDLASNWDVGRSLTARARSIIDAMVSGDLPERVLIVSDNTAVGKTTILRRLAYDLARRGAVVLNCSALSRVDIRPASEALDLIDDPVIIVIDGFAEQAAAIARVLNSIEKRDIVLLAADRDYRQRHIVRSLGDIPYRLIDGLDLNEAEAIQLVNSYVRLGLTGADDATKHPRQFARRLIGEPIAVACCHILSDMRPLDTIVQSTYLAASVTERARYLIAALAQYCLSAGVRYDILASAAGRDGWDNQFQAAHPLPLCYYDEPRRNFVVPLNATLAERTLTRAPAEDVAKTFERLALGIAPRVNREAIRNRTPEARLARRLFDYEDVICRFLNKGAGSFYAKVQSAWQWNSRYWEQVALYDLAKFRSEGEEFLLRQAIQHARHAVSIEAHPFPLTTLGKVLLAQMGRPGISNNSVYSEAKEVLQRAIEAEHLRNRTSVHAYVTLFHGSLDYLALGEDLSGDEVFALNELVDGAKKYFPRDKELRELAERLGAQL